jgi:hypothetical protein
MLMIFPMLMCAVSLTLYKTMVMTVHNQYSDIELASPVYFCNRGTCYEYHVERTDNSAMIKLDLKFDLDQDELEGILIYEVRKKRKYKA